MQRVGHKLGDDTPWLLRLEQCALLKGIDEALVLLLVHGVLALETQGCLHVRVYPAGSYGDAGDVGLLDGKMSRDGVDGCLGGAVGAPGNVRLERCS